MIGTARWKRTVIIATNRIRLTAVIMAVLLAFAAPSPLTADDSCQARTVLLKNREYADTLLRDIREARSSIFCSCYLFKITGSRANLPRRIAEELISARRRGVAVSVVLEKDSGRNNDRLGAENRHTAAFLARGGVKVIFDSPSVVTHAKAVVIDRRYVFLGSHNLTQSALRHNNELSARIDSPEMATEVTAYLEKL